MKLTSIMQCGEHGATPLASLRVLRCPRQDVGPAETLDSARLGPHPHAIPEERLRRGRQRIRPGQPSPGPKPSPPQPRQSSASPGAQRTRSGKRRAGMRKRRFNAIATREVGPHIAQSPTKTHDPIVRAVAARRSHTFPPKPMLTINRHTARARARLGQDDREDPPRGEPMESRHRQHLPNQSTVTAAARRHRRPQPRHRRNWALANDAADTRHSPRAAAQTPHQPVRPPGPQSITLTTLCHPPSPRADFRLRAAR